MRNTRKSSAKKFKWSIDTGTVFKISVVLFLCSLCHATVEERRSTTDQPNSETMEMSGKIGKLRSLSTSSIGYGIQALQNELPPTVSIDDLSERQLAFQGRLHRSSEFTLQNNTLDEESPYSDLNNFDPMTPHRRLVEDLLDPSYYDNTVHPCVNFQKPVRVNLSMSLYQILHVDERSQSITVNVQDWYDEFLDWNPVEYDMINRTILPYDSIFIPDTFLYNSEALEQKRTEANMNVIATTGHWRNNSRDTGAHIQLMFPAIYKLTCKMNVIFFPYDQQNCTFIISSWTHDSSTIDYYALVKSVNLKNFVKNGEWDVISFDFVRIEQDFKCCPKPWVMLYAHLVIRRKCLYYLINLVVPTSIITTVAVCGFFSPSSTSSERDEKIYLGINTLLTMSIMLMMISNKMPSTSQYIPLMGWYFMGIIFVIVCGTLLATSVLFLHSRKVYNKPIPRLLRKIVTHRLVWTIILEPPIQLIEIWTEFGLISETRLPCPKFDAQVTKILEPTKSGNPFALFSSSQISNNTNTDSYKYERRLASVTKQYTDQLRLRHRRERKRRETLQNAADFLTFGTESNNNSRASKKKKMMRRCALEWEYTSNVLDRMLLVIFCIISIFFFVMIGFFDTFYTIE
ncbi:ACR-5-like protein [Aphelenchoides besseyi]|nr:ACR-5-like protein [Aphelenchoides besseyi]